MKHFGKALIGTGLFLCLSQGIASGQQPQQIWQAYRIGPEDVLTISVWKNPDLTRQVQVRPDGMISLPLLNDVKAAGTTPMQLREIIRDGLSEFIGSPEVSIIVDQIHSFKVSILGKVNAPGRYELRSPTTALDALALAGGFARDEFSSPDELVVLRPAGKAMRRIPINYKTAISAGGRTVNIYLQPNDILVVPD